MKPYVLLILTLLLMATGANSMLLAQSNAPTNLKTTSTAYNQVVLAWEDKSTNETRFEIERKDIGAFVKIGEVTANIVTYTDNTVTASNAYIYRIKAVFVTNANYSNELTVNTPQQPPGTPTGLSVALQGGSVLVKWDNGGGGTATSYRVERSVQGGAYSLYQTVAYSRTPSLTDNGVQSGQQYCYRVQATNGGGSSGFAGPACQTIPLAPTGVTNLKATALNSNAIKLTWTAYGKENPIFIEQRTGQTGSWSRVSTSQSSLGEYTATNLNANTEYCYRIGEDGREYSSVACATTQQNAPNAPGRLTATAVSSSQINLQWADLSENETGFQVERGDSPTAPFTKIADLGANSTSYNDQNLAASKQYCYQVRAINNVGPSGHTSTECATTQAPPVGVPQNLVAVAISTTQINLTWNSVSGATTYQLERSPNGNDNWTKIADLPANATSYANTGLTPNTRYFYRVRAVNAVGQSAYSNVADETTPDSPPTAPARLTATAVSITQINVAWADLSNNERGFEVERGSSATAPFTKIADLPANATSYEDKNLTDAAAYCYRVRAVNAAGPSPYTDPACATTPLAPPVAPVNLTAKVFDYDQIQLNWTPLGPKAVTVVVERATNPAGPFTEIKQQPAAQNSYVDMGLQEFTTYYYRIKAVNTAGISGYSNVASARVEEIIIAVEDELETHTTLIVSERRLHVVTNWFSMMQTNIQLHTATGQPVLTDTRKVRPADRWEYSLDTLPTGLYIVNIIADGRKLAKRIILP